MTQPEPDPHAADDPGLTRRIPVQGAPGTDPAAPPPTPPPPPPAGTGAPIAPPQLLPPPPLEATIPMKVAPPMPESRVPEPPAHRSRVLYWAAGGVALLILGGSLGYYLMYPSGEGPASLNALKAEDEEVPPVLRPYLDRASQGDPSAMRMLGTMYYNGLNVRQDRREGIRWYRKAAAAGSVAARKDLEQLGLSVNEK